MRSHAQRQLGIVVGHHQQARQEQKHIKASGETRIIHAAPLGFLLDAGPSGAGDAATKLAAGVSRKSLRFLWESAKLEIPSESELNLSCLVT